jgi:hypothetical protein
MRCKGGERAKIVASTDRTLLFLVSHSLTSFLPELFSNPHTMEAVQKDYEKAAKKQKTLQKQSRDSVDKMLQHLHQSKLIISNGAFFSIFIFTFMQTLRWLQWL